MRCPMAIRDHLQPLLMWTVAIAVLCSYGLASCAPETGSGGPDMQAVARLVRYAFSEYDNPVPVMGIQGVATNYLQQLHGVRFVGTRPCRQRSGVTADQGEGDDGSAGSTWACNVKIAMAISLEAPAKGGHVPISHFRRTLYFQRENGHWVFINHGLVRGLIIEYALHHYGLEKSGK